MIRCGLVLGGILIAGVIQDASSAPMPISQADKDQYCETLDVVAREIMLMRQSGFPMPQAMKIAVDAAELQQEKDLGRDMVIKAYAQNRWQTKRQQQVEIDKFADYWTSLCYRQAGK